MKFWWPFFWPGNPFFWPKVTRKVLVVPMGEGEGGVGTGLGISPKFYQFPYDDSS